MLEILGLSGQSFGGFDLGHNIPSLSESSNKASMVLALCSCVDMSMRDVSIEIGRGSDNR